MQVYGTQYFNLHYRCILISDELSMSRGNRTLFSCRQVVDNSSHLMMKKAPPCGRTSPNNYYYENKTVCC